MSINKKYISSKDTIEIIEFIKNDTLEVSFRVYPADENQPDSKIRQASIQMHDVQEWAEREEKLQQSQWNVYEDDTYLQAENFIEYYETEFEQNEIEEFLFDYFSSVQIPPIK